MKRNKTQKGITLIALIITIIILLILAVVAIKAIRDNGITEQAFTATERHALGSEKEIIQLAYADYQTNKSEPVKRTEDQDELERFFLGNDGQGVNARSLINTEKSTEDVYIVDYKDEEIQVKMSEAVFNSETNEIYFYFSYNGNTYKLTVNDNEGVLTKKLEATKEQLQLKVNNAEVKGNEKEGWTIRFSESGNRYKLSSEGVLSEPEKTIALAEGNLAKAYEDGELKIGDTVMYVPESGKSITILKGTIGNNIDATVSTDETPITRWRVMDVNDATGVVTLVSNSTIKIGSSSNNCLVAGKAGYNKGANKLHEMCSVFGTGKGATSARSLTVEDVNKVLNFDKTQYEDPNNGNTNDNPMLNRKYGYKMTYYSQKTTWDPVDTFKYADGRTEYIRTGDDRVFTDINGNVATDEKPISLETTHYWYGYNDVKVDSKIKTMMLGSSGSMDTLLASTAIETRVNEAYWGMNEIYLGRVMTAPLYWSNAYGEVEYTTVRAIRPVVILEANVLGEKNADGVWQLK